MSGVIDRKGNDHRSSIGGAARSREKKRAAPISKTLRGRRDALRVARPWGLRAITLLRALLFPRKEGEGEGEKRRPAVLAERRNCGIWEIPALDSRLFSKRGRGEGRGEGKG